MRMALDLRCAVLHLLTSLCLRYGVGMPSVWLRRRACNSPHFNDLGFDYPLTFAWLLCVYLSNGKVQFRGFRSQPATRRTVRRFKSERTRVMNGHSSNDVGFSLPIAKGVAIAPVFLCGTVPRSLAQLAHRCAAMSFGRHRNSHLAHSKVAHESVRKPRGLQSLRCGVFCHETISQERTEKEPIMNESRGAVSFTPLFTTGDIGLPRDASVEHVVKVFLTVGEALAARWIQMPRGVLLLQSVPDQDASGAIYLYDRERHIFFFIDFVNGRNDTLTAAEFDQLVAEYDLVSWTANPHLLPANLPNLGTA